MKTIRLLGLYIDSFKSFTKPITIDFTDAQSGFNFLGGRNELEPRLGANGAGKSSLWDALCWCLYGTSVLGNRSSELVSWGKKRPNVIAIISINGSALSISRQGSPEAINLKQGALFSYADSQSITQTEIDSLIGLTKPRFVQSVLFGQGAKLFLDLSLPDRADLLDEILDLSLWQRLSDKAGKQQRNLELIDQQIQRDLAFTAGQLESLQKIEELELLDIAWRDAKTAKALEVLDEAEALERKLLPNIAQEVIDFEAMDAELAGKRALHLDISHQRNALMLDAQNHYQANQRLVDEIRFFEKHKECPTCSQKINQAFIKTKSAELLKNANIERDAYHSRELEAQQLKEFLDRLVDDIEASQTKKRELQIAHRTSLAEQTSANERLARLFEEAEKLAAEAESSPYSAQIAKARESKAFLEAELASLHARQNGNAEQIRYADYWKAGFKKVRLYLIKQVLAMLEIETAAAAASLGLPGWSIKYVTETETKSGKLRTGVQIQVHSPSASGNWALWSGGESQRIRLAISIGMSNMIQRMAGIDFKLEIWDEPSAWLSPEGIDDLMESLKYRASMTEKPLWILDHRVFDQTNFDAVWIMVKDRDGSHLECS